MRRKTCVCVCDFVCMHVQKQTHALTHSHTHLCQQMEATRPPNQILARGTKKKKHKCSIFFFFWKFMAFILISTVHLLGSTPTKGVEIKTSTLDHKKIITFTFFFVPPAKTWLEWHVAPFTCMCVHACALVVWP